MSDVITDIMEAKNHKIFTYVDDFIIVGSKSNTERAFHDVTALFTKLGLFMNPEKQTQQLDSSNILELT